MIFLADNVCQPRVVRRRRELGLCDNVIIGFQRIDDLPIPKNSIVHRKVLNGISFFSRIRWLRTDFTLVRSLCSSQLIYAFGFYWAMLSLLAGKKYVYEIADLHYLTKRSSSFYRLLDWFIATNSVYFVVTSPKFADFLKVRQFGLLHNMPLSFFSNVSNSKATSLQKKSYGFVGKLRSSKEILSTFSLLSKKMTGSKALFYGYTKEDLPENIVVHNTFNYSDISIAYEELEFVICTYGDRGNERLLLPNKLYESAFFGTSIICSSETYSAEMVEKWKLGLIKSKDNELLDYRASNIKLARQRFLESCYNTNLETYRELKLLLEQ